MDYNGMTEEEYLDSLLKQASDDMPKENAAEQVTEESEPEQDPTIGFNVDNEPEIEEQETEFDFDDIFGTLAEADSASAESVSEEIKEEHIEAEFVEDLEQMTEESTEYSVDEPVDEVTEESIENLTEESSEEPIENLTEESSEEPDFMEDFFAQMENEMESVSIEDEIMQEEDSSFEDIAALFENAVDFEEEVVQSEENSQQETQTEAEDTAGFEDFHRSLDSIIGELEKEREDSDNEEIDIFSQINNTELSDEELSQDIDDMSLLEAVGMLLDEEKANDKQQDFDGLFDFDDEIPEKSTEEPVAKVKKEKPKKELFKKFKNFLVEQGEDTEEDIAAEEAAALAKEEKAKQAEEDKEKKAEEKAAKKEQAEQAKAAKKAEREGKALERQMKKEQKKAEQEASGEPKYNVTVIKLALLFTIVAASGILLWAISSFNYRRISKKEAMIYFTADQYELAYEKIAGLEPRKSEEIFFEQVRTVMYVQKQYDSYLNYYNIGMKEEALDALFKGIDKYDKYYETADDLGILDDMDKVLGKIYTALEETFNLSQENAAAIANIVDSADYSVELRKVINSIKE